MVMGTHYESQRLIEGYEEADLDTYHCPFCGFEKDVAVQFDLHSRMFYPLKWADTDCDKCGEQMDRIGVNI